MALFDRMADRVGQRAQLIARRTLDLAEAAIAEFPDVMLRREENELVISGRGLVRRWMSDVRLRFALWRSQ